MKRILVVSGDRVGREMSGPGIRSYHFARALAGSFRVTLAAPFDGDVELPGVELVEAPSGRALEELALAHDVVLAQYLPPSLVRRLARSSTRAIYDVYVPSATEGLAWVAGEAGADPLAWRATVLLQRLQLASGDAFICASERQRDFYLGVLASVCRIDPQQYGRDPSLRDLIDVVPSGVPRESPPPDVADLDGVGAEDKVLLWAGGIWNWLDPLTPIRAVAALAERRPDVKLVFLGRKHPDLASMQMARRAEELACELGVLGGPVCFHAEWVPYEERSRYLSAAAVGVSAHFENVETRLAFRTRLLDYFWAGLPTVTTGGDVLGELVEREQLGRAVAAGDVDGWVAALEAVLDPTERARIELRLSSVRERFAWPRVIEPIARLAAAETPKANAATWSLEAERLVLRTRVAIANRGLLGTAGRGVARLVRRSAPARDTA